MKKLALHDDLTNLFNRRYIVSRVNRENRRTSHPNNRHSLQILYIDLDNFKPFNDKFGHSSGDDVLVQVANVLNSTTRAQDIVGRIGGDEFIIIFINKDLEFAEAKANEIITAIKSMDTGYGDIKLSASIGISESKNSNPLSRPIDTADEAMRNAKNNGKKGVFVINNKSTSEV